MKKYAVLYAVLFSLCAALYASGTAHPSALQVAARDGTMLRLHVVAASDDPCDQQTKLHVRDAVLALCGPRLETAQGDPDTMQRIVEQSLPEIEFVARAAAKARGYDGPVTASFGLFDFPKRDYAGEIVPAGTYRALRVVLGDGAGANWWCVMYPQLCFIGEEAVTPDEQPEVQFTSVILDWLSQLTGKN